MYLFSHGSWLPKDLLIGLNLGLEDGWATFLEFKIRDTNKTRGNINKNRGSPNKNRVPNKNRDAINKIRSSIKTKCSFSRKDRRKGVTAVTTS